MDLNVSSALRGDFSAAHLTGTTRTCSPPTRRKNTVFAFARDGIASPEAFGIRLATHFAGSYPWISGARVAWSPTGGTGSPSGGSRTTTRSGGGRR